MQYKLPQPNYQFNINLQVIRGMIVNLTFANYPLTRPGNR